VTTDPGQSAAPASFPGPVTGALFAATAGYSASLIALEDQAAQVASAPLRARIAEILRRLTALYTRLAGSLDAPLPPDRAPQLLAQLATELGSLRSLDPSPVIADFATRAYHAATAFAQEQLGPLAVDQLPGVLADDAVKQALDSLPGSVAERIDDALRFLEQTPAVDLNSVVLQPVAKANQAANSAEAAARWSVNRGANAGSSDSARLADAFVLWAGERNACVHCAAYIGHFVRPGDSFPVGLTFGDSPLTPWPDPDRLLGPPLHPNCRCHEIAWFGPAATHPVDTAIYNRPALQDQVDIAAALRREAKRSILRGWSLPSESEAVRLRAADRLLRQGAGLPKTVEERARKAVKAKRFPDRHIR
jgi:hypothetical protein